VRFASWKQVGQPTMRKSRFVSPRPECPVWRLITIPTARTTIVASQTTPLQPNRRHSCGDPVGSLIRPASAAELRQPYKLGIGQLAIDLRTTALPAGESDTVVVPWSGLAIPGSTFLTAADRLLRPGGRLLVIHDYGRDDVWELMPDRRERLVEWSHRHGPFLGSGYRVRVIHCWWTFESIEAAATLLEAGFGELGARVAGRMKRPRLEYQVAIYHRTVVAPPAAVD